MGIPYAVSMCWKGMDFVTYWRRAIYGAAAARLIADATKACDPEEAFIAALSTSDAPPNEKPGKK